MMDFGMLLIGCGCIELSMASGVAVSMDCQLKGAFSNATHALSVEHVHWNGLVDTQSSNDMVDVILPSQDITCASSVPLR
jgi:hypothetical protein